MFPIPCRLSGRSQFPGIFSFYKFGSSSLSWTRVMSFYCIFILNVNCKKMQRRNGNPLMQEGFSCDFGLCQPSFILCHGTQPALKTFCFPEICDAIQFDRNQRKEIPTNQNTRGSWQLCDIFQLSSLNKLPICPNRHPLRHWVQNYEHVSILCHQWRKMHGISTGLFICSEQVPVISRQDILRIRFNICLSLPRIIITYLFILLSDQNAAYY